MAERKEYYLRFTPVQRAQHWLMTLSFTMLALTGLPQRYALAGWAEWVIGALGGIEQVRVIHRVSAVVFILVTLYHFVMLAYKVWVLRVEMSMLPGLKDVTDMLDAVRYNLGLARRHPRLGRYTFAEKIEYWSLIWGSVLMIVTGFMLWNPIATAGQLPGEFIPAAKTAHSAEALLAVLAVVIWHFYGVHVKTFNRSMFMGKLTRRQMEAEHAAELEMIEQGRVRAPVRREVKRARERMFLPLATVGMVVLLSGVYTFVTFEQTAITTVPPAERVQAFVPATATPTRTPTATPEATATSALAAGNGGSSAATTAAGDEGTLLSLMVIPHEVEGRENCLLCHALGGALPMPADHEGRPETTCLVCHATTEAEEHLPVPVKHDLEGRENCLMCHAVDVLPESHKAGAFSNSDCLLCHEPAATSPGVGSITQTAAPAASSTEGVSFAQSVLPSLEVKCTTCHGEMALGELQLTSYQSLMAGGQDGPVVVAGSPDESPIVTKMRDGHSAVLSADELQTLVDWIGAGAEDN